jgi:hypothetical protein
MRFRQLVALEIWEGRLEFDVAGKQLAGRTHRRVGDVVADAGQRAIADQLPLTALGAISRDREMAKGRAVACAPAAGDVLLERPVVEQVELDQFHPLVFEIDQRAVNADLAIQNAKAGVASLRLRTEISGAPVIRPVDSGSCTLRQRPGPAPAARMRLAHLAEKTIGALLSERKRSAPERIETGREDGQIVVLGASRSARDEDRRRDECCDHARWRLPHFSLPRSLRCPPVSSPADCVQIQQ